MDDRDLPLGRIGPYRLEARLGRGGMGEVFLAYAERLGRRVAIKRVRWGPGIPPSTLERLRREARATASLNHPAIVQVYDLVPDGEGDAIVMEYILGRSLDSFVGDPVLTPALAVRLAGEVAGGLAHAHAGGFVHRDLKAENVMVTGAGRAKILDFGLAKPVLPGGEDSLTVAGAVIGTYRSMSPEQAGGDEVDGRSDLFSLGVLLYEMLTGRTPFQGANPLATLKRVLTETPEPLADLRPDLPPTLTTLVDRLLAKNREERPQTAEEVARSLEEIANLPGLGQGFSILPEGSGEELTEPTLDLLHPVGHLRTAPRHQPWALLVALVPLVGIAATFFFLLKPIASASPALSVEDKEYQQIKLLMEAGKTAPEEELPQLQKLIGRFPHFAKAQIAAGEVAHSLYQSTKESQYLERAKRFAAEAEALDSRNSDLLGLLFKLALSRLEASHPGDLSVRLYRASLEERRGEMEAAVADLRAVVKVDPYWMNLLRLARCEARIGRIEEARGHLRTLLVKSPDNYWGLEAQAQIELEYGSLEQAEKLYENLIKNQPGERGLWTNLGLARFFLGRYEEAFETYSQAVKLGPLNATLLLNLADTQLALGKTNDAELPYRQAWKLLADKPETSLTPEELTYEAECLAHLGRIQDAKDLVERARRRSPSVPLVTFQASLVYALAGDRTQALAYASQALHQGIGQNWFRIPAFDLLNPELHSLLPPAKAP
jgi:serine/threonine-protein kinase